MNGEGGSLAGPRKGRHGLFLVCLAAVGFKDVSALQPHNVINFLLACGQCFWMLAAGPLEQYLLGESSGHGLE